MQDGSLPSGRCILYYPTITVPNGRWLRQALLYWDEIGSVVPYGQDRRDYLPNDKDTAYLMEQGVYKPFRPMTLLEGHYDDYELFVAEFRSILNSTTSPILPTATRSLVNRGVRADQDALARTCSRIHQNKVSSGMFRFLQQRGLARRIHNDQEWYYFENKTALLYMALLAKHLARIDQHHTVAGTDNSRFDSLMFYRPRTTSQIGVSAYLSNILPLPTEDTSLERIVEFKRTHRNELYRFRAWIDQFEAAVIACQDPAEARRIVTSFQEQLEASIADLRVSLNSSRVKTILGSLKTLVRLDSPTLWGTIGIAVNQATKLVDLPLSWSFLGVGVVAAIELSAHIIDGISQNRGTLRASPLAYVLHAKEDGIAG